ncbi:MAG: DUF45 domain-containing protein [Acholeplasma sp.]|nr:DUF45 domain-containing protein [Acholeplasma sp.]
MIVEKNGLSIEIILKPKKIKHAYFHFKPGYVVVSKPRHITEAQIKTFIQKKFDSFYQKTHQVQILPTYFGKQLYISIKKGSEFSYVVGDDIQITSPFDEANTLKMFYKKELEKKVIEHENWLKETLKPLQLPLVPVKVKWLKSKYGSCHIVKKEITLNAFLAKLDTIYLKYVLLHEYAHILVPNHQKPFYDVLDIIMPGHKEIQKALKKHHL